MREDSPTIDKTALLELVSLHYALAIDTVTFVPSGECSYDYLLECASGERYFCKIHTRTARPDLVPARLAAVSALQREEQMPQIVSPRLTSNETYTVEHETGPLALFPYIEGQWLRDSERSMTDFEEIATLLAHFHNCNPTLVSRVAPALVERFVLHFEAQLVQLLADVRAGTTACFPAVTTLLNQHSAEISAAWEHLRTLQAAARSLHYQTVVTHGDPTPGNLLKTAPGVWYLIDWDDLALGPIERDLIYFSGAAWSPFLRAYTQIRHPPPLRAELLDYYQYLWDLQEIADYGSRLFYTTMSTDEQERCWQEFTQYLPIRHTHIAATTQALISG